MGCAGSDWPWVTSLVIPALPWSTGTWGRSDVSICCCRLVCVFWYRIPPPPPPPPSLSLSLPPSLHPPPSLSLLPKLPLSACLSVCLPTCLPACLLACLPACLPTCLYVCLSVYRRVSSLTFTVSFFFLEIYDDLFVTL